MPLQEAILALGQDWEDGDVIRLTREPRCTIRKTLMGEIVMCPDGEVRRQIEAELEQLRIRRATGKDPVVRIRRTPSGQITREDGP